MIDQITLLEKIDKVAAVCRRFGLSGLPPAGKNFLKPLFGDRISVHVEGLDISASLEHRHYLQALRRGEIESLTTNLFACVIRPGMVVVDIGAFVGWYTLLAARQVGERGKVYAFEPDPRNYELLSENLRVNQLHAQAICLPQAVSNQAGFQRIFRGADQSRDSSIPCSDEGTSIMVPKVVLDEILDPTLRVDVIKLDIDGGEVNALRGMRETLKRAAPTVKLFVECNPVSLERAGESAQSLAAELRELGFAIFLIDEVRPGLKPVDSTIESAKHVKLFCLRV
jgi:FkbM family methyltransferase